MDSLNSDYLVLTNVSVENMQPTQTMHLMIKMINVADSR